MTQIITGKCPEEIAEFDNHLLVGRVDYGPAPFKLGWLKPEGLTFPGRYDISIGEGGTGYGVSGTFYEAPSFPDLLNHLQVNAINPNYGWLNIQIENINGVDWITLVGTDPIVIPVEDFKLSLKITGDPGWIIEPTEGEVGKDISTIILDPEWEQFGPCELVEVPSSGGLPTPRIMLDAGNVEILDYTGTQTLSMSKFPVCIVSDFTDAQITAGVKLEFMYFRSQKKAANSNGSAKSGFVHPSPVSDVDGFAIYPNDPFRGGNSLLYVFNKKSERDVTQNGQKIPFWEGLSGQFRVGNVKYRDTAGITQLKTVTAPKRRFVNISANLSSRVYYNARFAPLYIRARFAVLQPNGEWISGPMSDVFTVTTRHHPFIYTPEFVGPDGEKCCIVNPHFQHQQLQCFAGPGRLPTTA